MGRSRPTKRLECPLESIQPNRPKNSRHHQASLEILVEVLLERKRIMKKTVVFPNLRKKIQTHFGRTVASPRKNQMRIPEKIYK